MNHESIELLQEIALLEIKARTPGHPRFKPFRDGVWFDADLLADLEDDLTSRYPALKIAAQRKLESACCLAIVWWEDKSKAYYGSAPVIDGWRMHELDQQAGQWRRIRDAVLK